MGPSARVKGRGFGRYWLGETISEVGSQITLLALPLTAITLLGAGPAEVGALATAGFLPYLLVGPFAGVIVDRLPRRPLLAASYIASAGLLVTIPVASLGGSRSHSCSSSRLPPRRSWLSRASRTRQYSRRS